MSTAQKPAISPEQYLDRERHANHRSEYYRGEMFAMAGGSWEHALIKDNLARETGNQLKSCPCRVVTSDLRVKVAATGLYTYPDLTIVCDEPLFEDGVMDTLLNPRIIAEVLSESTERYDRGAKFGHYRQITSVYEYLLVAQDRQLIEQYSRQSDNSWVLKIFDQSNPILYFASVSAQVPLDEIYRGVKLPEIPSR